MTVIPISRAVEKPFKVSWTDHDANQTPKVQRHYKEYATVDEAELYFGYLLDLAKEDGRVFAIERNYH